MKNENVKVDYPSRTVINQYYKLSSNKEFRAFIKTEKEKLRRNITNREQLVAVKKAITEFLYHHSLPSNWQTPIYLLIVDAEIDYPMEAGITLKVGDNEVTAKRMPLLPTKNEKASEPNSISIELTAKVSVNKIIQFIEANRSLIEQLLENVELPEQKVITWKKTELAKKIIDMKDKHRMSFTDISDKLSQEERLYDEDRSLVADANYVKTLYNRYKKNLMK